MSKYSEPPNRRQEYQLHTLNTELWETHSEQDHHMLGSMLGSLVQLLLGA